MKYDQFNEATSLVDDDVLLIQEASTLALKKVKLSTLRQYIDVAPTQPTLPMPVSGSIKWYRSDNLILSGTAVLGMKDKATGFDLNSISTNSLLISSAINNRSAVRFNTSPMKALQESYAAKTIYIVYRANETVFNDYNAFTCYRASSCNLLPPSNELNIVSGVATKNNVYGEGATKAYLDNSPVTLSSYTFYDAGVFAGNLGQFHLLESVHSNSVAGNKSLCFGADSYAFSRSLINVDIAEVIIYPFVLTEAQRTENNNYFKQMYAFSFL